MFRSQAESKTHFEVWRELVKALAPVGIDEALLKRLFSVTDQGSNVAKAMKSFNKKSMTRHSLGILSANT